MRRLLAAAVAATSSSKDLATVYTFLVAECLHLAVVLRLLLHHLCGRVRYLLGEVFTTHSSYVPLPVADEHAGGEGSKASGDRFAPVIPRPFRKSIPTNSTIGF